MKQKKERKTWNEMYGLATNYYSYYGNLEVQSNFKTFDGINGDKNGFALGAWIQTQRQAKKGRERYKITEEQIQKLEKIGMIWNIYEKKWNEMYKLATNYYNYYGNLEIEVNFKTLDGINKNEEGFTLGAWIQMQRQAKKERYKITEEQIQKLNQIGMIWDLQKENWNKMYKLATNYYNHYGDLEIQSSFKTVDGVNEDKEGIALGNWIQNQRAIKEEQKLTRKKKEQIEKLDQIGMIWDVQKEIWNKMYKLATNYYNYYGNLEIQIDFITVDGINKNEEGVALGWWIQIQRQGKKGNRKITEDRIQKLEEIGMIWDVQENKWNEMYRLAINYYNCYRNLKIRGSFKTLDGINKNEEGVALGNWIRVQRQAKKGKNKLKITEEQIKKLDQIGMIWDIGKNNLDIINLCNQYKIDISKNGFIKNKSYNEVYAKICYLNDNNIIICNNGGELHPIFSMSDINMQIKYLISLQDLIKKYIPEQEKGIQIVLK